MCKVKLSQADACEECALKCSLIHRKRRDPSSVVSSFFKVMIDDRFSEFLPVPPRFAPRLRALVDQETRVEDSSGRKWTMTLTSLNGCLAFERGWHAFSLDHGIELGDIVIVHYILDSHFVVQIYGRSGCEKLILPSENKSIQNKRTRTTTNLVTRDGPCNRRDKDSSTFFDCGSYVAAVPGTMELEGSSKALLGGCAHEKNIEESHQIVGSREGCFEEPYLMMVNRGTPFSGEDERGTLLDMFSSEMSNIKPVGKVGSLQKGNGSSNDQDRTDNHIAFEDALKGTFDAEMNETTENGNCEARSTSENNYKSNNGRGEGNWDSEMNSIQLESGGNGEISEQLLNGYSNDKDLLDSDAAFQDLVKDSLDVKRSETNEKGTDEVLWTSEMDHKSNIGTMQGNMFLATNTSELGDGNSVISLSKESTPAIGGSQCTTVHSYPRVYRSLTAAPVSERIGYSYAIGQNLKIVKTEQKEFNQEQVGSELKPYVTSGNLGNNLKAATGAGELHRILKGEPVHHIDFLSPLEVTCFVTPESESFLVMPKGLPLLEVNGKIKLEEKVVMLRDPGGRLWPVLYHEKDGLKALVDGWQSFRRANGIRPGDECLFALENEFECIYRVQIIHS